MNFYELYSQIKKDQADPAGITSADVEKALSCRNPDSRHFRALLSPEALPYLEEMAGKARDITQGHFGKAILLYAPLYVSNYCDNKCLYCGFNLQNKIQRKKLTLEEVEKEASFIASSGLRHILLLTGGSRTMSPLSYIKDCVKVLRKYFTDISVEIYALTEEEYAGLVSAGVDALTIYQEVYDEKTYTRMHPAGPKSDYAFRLGAPERGARAGMRSVSIGTLLGLDEWRREVFWLGMHAKYLQDNFPAVDVGASLPRLKPHEGAFRAPYDVSDMEMAQIITALRIFLPRLGISLSTREGAAFRENLLPLGITRISAGSSTYVGGHAAYAKDRQNIPQFEISDKRSVAEIMAALKLKGYQPVLKDWLAID